MVGPQTSKYVYVCHPIEVNFCLKNVYLLGVHLNKIIILKKIGFIYHQELSIPVRVYLYYIQTGNSILLENKIFEVFYGYHGVQW